ncbi:hypothetical protein D1007_31721 [Hordeum vulgare]|nr:hypothetical protein D1007_31721 [Hordeum vulgare]
MDNTELANVAKPADDCEPTLQAASSSISVARGMKECISAIGQEHKALDRLIMEVRNDSGDKNVRLDGLQISMTCIAKIAVPSAKGTTTYGLKMTRSMVGGLSLEWHPNPKQGPINLDKAAGETTSAATPQKTLAKALSDVMHMLRGK